jgi:hypothetical protein
MVLFLLMYEFMRYTVQWISVSILRWLCVLRRVGWSQMLPFLCLFLCSLDSQDVAQSVDFEMAIKPGSVRLSATEILLGVDLG